MAMSSFASWERANNFGMYSIRESMTAGDTVWLERYRNPTLINECRSCERNAFLVLGDLVKEKSRIGIEVKEPLGADILLVVLVRGHMLTL